MKGLPVSVAAVVAMPVWAVVMSVWAEGQASAVENSVLVMEMLVVLEGWMEANGTAIQDRDASARIGGSSSARSGKARAVSS